MKTILSLLGVLTICIMGLALLEPKSNIQQYDWHCNSSNNGYFFPNDSWDCFTTPYEKSGHQVVDSISYDGSTHKGTFNETTKS